MSNVIFWSMCVVAAGSAWRVFRADSMVRAAYWLMLSFVAVGIIMVQLGAEFLGLVLLLMMAGEMTIMAVFMVMFMMNPAGLNPMTMVHQHRTAIVAGVIAFAGLTIVALVGHFRIASAPSRQAATAALGTELLGDSMLVFETAGVTLLATMIGSLAIVSRKGRHGDAMEGSVEPGSDITATATPVGRPMGGEAAGEHAGHAMTGHSSNQAPADGTDHERHSGGA